MKTIHLVTHTHWDREWYLTFQQFRLRLVHLMDHVLDLLGSDPGFISFTLDGQTIVLEDYLAMRPEREEELRAHIRSGRLLIGPWYVLPDEFLVSPEALIRNLLQGDRVARRFGPAGEKAGQAPASPPYKMMVGYIPDPFGHIGQMPQILRGFGIESACLTRGLSDEPCELGWQAPDGSCVLLAYQRDSYGNAANLPASQPEMFLAEICRLRDSLLPYTSTSHVLLMHGSDHVVPPAETSIAIEKANAALATQGDRLVHSTLPAYFQAVQEEIGAGKLEIPTVCGELRSSKRFPLLPNVLSTRMWIKQRNHACQTLLEKWAEPFSTWAELTTADHRRQTAVGFGGLTPRVNDPAPILRQAWRQLLECHPHDSICGCSIDQVHEEMRSRFDQVEQIGEEITRQSLELLAASIDTRPPGSLPGDPRSAIIVFNPAAGPRAELVSLELELPSGLDAGDPGGGFEIVDESGNILPHQVLDTTVHEIFSMPLDREGLRAALSMVQDGQIQNMFIQEVGFRRDGSTLFIDLVMAEKETPDPEKLRQGLAALEKWLEEATVTTFLARARSAAVAQLQFAAQGVPESGYRTFWLRPASSAISNRASRLREGVIENEYLKAEISPVDGTLSLEDKRTGILFAGLNRFEDGGDCGDEYNFAPPAKDFIVANTEVVAIETHYGPARQTIEVSLVLQVPAELAPDRQARSESLVSLPVTTQISLVPGLPRLDIRTTVDNGPAGGPARVRDHRLRAHFPFSFSGQPAPEAIYDGHFELVRRPVALPFYDSSWSEPPRPEQPQRAFTGVSCEDYGLIVANRGLPEVEILSAQGNGGPSYEIALTLMRSVGWLSRGDLATRKGNAGPMLATHGAQMPGVHTFEYALIPHPAGPESSLTIPAYQHAYAFNAPLRAVSAGLHPGGLPSQASLVRVSPQAFIVSAVKTAEDGSGWLVRGYNLAAQPIQVTITPWKPFQSATRVNLAEEIEETLSGAPDGNIAFSARGHQIVTVKFSV